MKNHAGYRFSFMGIIILLAGMVMWQPSPAKAQGLSYNASINKSFAPIVIPAGGVSVLTLNLYNPNPFVLYLSSLPPAFTDTLPANVTFANPANPATTCTGATVSIVGTTLSVIGGTVPAQVGSTPGTCQVTVNVTSLVAGNWINTIPANSLTATDPTGTIDVSNSTPASATLQVNTVQPPSLSKSFAPNTQWVGQNSVLSVTIRNNDTNYGLSGITFSDSLPSGLVIGSPATAGNTNCGTPTITGPGGAALAPGDTAFTVRGATAPINGSCVIRVNVTTTTPNPYINNIPAGALTTTQGVTNSSAASAQVNFQTIGITKSFTPNSMQQGGVSKVVLTLQNPSAAAYTNAAITDNLPSGMTVVDTTTVPAALANPTTSCTSGSVIYTSNSVSLTGGTIPGSPNTCTITFYVTAGFAGTYTNTIPAGTLTASSPGGPVSTVVGTTANLTVYATGQGVSVTKSFGTNPMAVGGTSLLTINITAPADTPQLDNFSLTDSLPSGLTIATTSHSAPSGCGSGTLTAVPGTSLITYTGGTILASATCQIFVYVTSNTPGIYTNYISPTNISDTEGRTIPTTFSQSLTVSGLTASKSFSPTAVTTTGISTLTISLNNTNLSQLDDVSFTDVLPTSASPSASVVIAPTPNASTTCGSGTVTAVAGTQTIKLTGGTVPAQVGSVAGLCTVNVDVVGIGSNTTLTNTLPNTSPNWVTGTIHGTPTVIHNSNAPTASLTIRALSINIVKGFNPTQVFGGAPSTMSIVLTNPQNVALTGISFSDNLPQDSPGLGMFVANPPATTTGTCGGSFNAVAGASSFSYSGGTLAANATCTLTIAVSMNVINNRTNTIPANAVTTANGGKNGLETSASLTNLAWASVSKSFAPNPVALSTGVSTLTITIQSVGNVDLSGMGLVDDFSSAGGLTVVGSPTTTCTDGTMTNTATSIRLQNASLQSDSTCTVTVNLTAAAAGNKQNCIPVGALTDTQNVSNTAQACDTLVVIAPPTISKVFSPSTIAANATSTLTFTLRNPAANTVPLTGVGFTDVLPSGVVVPNLPNPSQCNGGTVSYDSGTNTIALTGGTIGVNTTCTVTAGVTSATGGSYLNTSNAVSSTNGGTGNSASATLTVISPPAITKDFAPNPITIGNDSVLHFQITNPNPSVLHNIAFTDSFPLGLQVASTPAASSTGCNAASTPTFNPSNGDTSLTFSNGSIAANGTCDIYVSVTANGGTYPNTTSAVSSLEGGTGNTASDTLVVQGAGLSLVKSTTTVGYQAPDDTITYNYLLTNTGDATLYSPFEVTDDHLGAAFSCGSATTLDPGETTNCTANYTIVPGDISTRSVTNTAFATAQDALNNVVTSNNSSTTVQLEQLTLLKTVPANTYYTIAGNSFTYTYTLTNTGLVTLYGQFTVTDDHFGSPLNCGAANLVLPPGANTFCTRTYTVALADVTAGFVTNVATASGFDQAVSGRAITSNTSSVTVYKVVAPTISKAFSPAAIAVGQLSTLTFTITNPGTNVIPLVGVGFSDPLPAGVTVAAPPVTPQCGGTVSSTATSITFSGGTVFPGTPPNNTCTVTVNVTGITAGTWNNTSSNVTSSNGGNGTVPATATLTVMAPPTITKSFSPGTILVGGTSTLTLTITAPTGNPVDLTGVGFTDDLPSGLQWASPASINLVNCTPTYSFSSGGTHLSITNTTIYTGYPCTIQIPVTATAAGTFYNTTSAVTTGNGGTGATSNTATLVANQAADLSITKDDGKLAFVRGQTITYNIVVTNGGPSDVSGATVVDTPPSSLTNVTWTCTPDSGASCTTSGTTKIDDTAVNIPNGKKVTYAVSATVSSSATTDIVNTAVVLPPAGLTDSNLDNNIATDTDQLNKLTIAKSVNPSTYATTGTTINYSYTITNTGTSTLSAPFAVVDNKVTPTCTSVPSTLAPNDSFTCTATYSTLQSDLDAGSIVNTVYATGVGPDGDTVTSNTDTKTVNATPDLYVTKSDGGVTATPGSHIIYTLKYRDVYHDATGVVLTETLPTYTTFDSADSTSGWNCSSGTCTFTVGSLTVAAGEKQVLFAVTVNSYVPAGVVNIHNTVSIDDDHSLGADATPADNTATTDTPLTAQPAFAITKSDGQTAVIPGQRLTYTINYSNTGNQGATGVVLTETLPTYTTFNSGLSTTGWSCVASTCTLAVGALAAGSSGNTGSATFVVDIANTVPSGVTQIVNTVTIDDDHSNGTTNGTDNKQTATDTDNLTAQPAFTISKTDGVTDATPGQTLTYTINYGNTGNQDATGVYLTETIPTNTIFVGPASWDCSATPTCKLSIGALAAGGSGSTTFVVTVNATVPSGATQIFNTVTIDDDHVNGDFHQTATDTDTLDAQPEFAISKSDGVTNAAPGQTLVYTMDYGNTGNQDATGVVLTETVPTNTTFNPGSSTTGWDCSTAPTCTLAVGDLAGGGTSTSNSATFAVNVNNPVPSGATQIFNMVTIDDDHANGDFHQTATDTDTLDAQPAFAISKDDGETAVVTGQRLTYTIEYGNTGDQSATGVVLTETIPDNTIYNASHSTIGWNCTTTTCTFSVGDLPGGGSISSNSVVFAVDVDATVPAGVTQVVNTVKIDDDRANGDFHRTATDTDTLNAQPAFTISKDDGQTTVVTGQTLVYTIDYSNVGDQGATGVTLTETIPANTTFDAADSTSGWSCAATTCTFTVGGLPAGTGNSGNVDFAVTVNVTVPAGVTRIVNTVSIDDDHANGVGSGGDNKQTATDTDDITAQPAFTISKTDGITQVAAGSQMTYTITVTNNGDQDATGVVVKDTLDSNVDFVSATPAGQATFDSGTHTVTWNGVALAAGATLSPAPTITVKVHNPLTGDPEPTQIINNVQVDDDHSNGVNPSTGDNTATASDTDGISFPTKAIVDHDGPDITLPQVAIGEGLLYETTVQITPGTVTNLKLVDTLDHGLAFWKCDSIYGTGSATGLTEDPAHTFTNLCANAAPTIEPSDSTDMTNAGRRIEFDFGTVSNTSTDVITLHVRYWAIVLDMTGTARGTTLNNSAQWTWDGGSVPAQAGAVTVLEPTLMLTKASDGTIPARGRVITYTLTLDHAAISNEDAYDVVLSDVVPLQMAYVPGSLKFISGQTPTQLIDSGAPTLQVKWDDFQLNPATPTVRQTVIQFQATVVNINPGQSITNTASLEWRSMHNPAGLSVARSPWNNYSTERYFDPTTSAPNNYRTSAQALIRAPELPNTGFAPGRVTLRESRNNNDAQDTSLRLEIPALKVDVPIVGIPYGTDGWDLTWLEKQAGYLEGTAYPTWTGNSVITGHVYNADGTAGIFVNLSTLKWGDQIIVHDGTGQEYIYEVRNVTRTTKDDLSPLQHEDNAWVTLLTCEGYNATTNQYTWRVAVGAVLIKVQPEQ